MDLLPFCDSRPEMDGFRFWKGGFWESHLGVFFFFFSGFLKKERIFFDSFVSPQDLPYHISALFVVDLERFRSLAAGDRLRATYNGLRFKQKNKIAFSFLISFLI